MVALKFFFLHNPKAGGASIRAALAEICDGSIAPTFWNAPNDYRRTPQEDRTHIGYDFYAGHYGHDVYARVKDGHILVTNFRDPVRRIYSLYQYWRHTVSADSLGALDPLDAELVALAQREPFSRFIRSENPDLALYLRNFHFRQIYGCGWTGSRMGWPELQLVKWRIRQMPWFFIAESAEASCLLLRDLSPRLANITIPRHNQSRVAGEEIEPQDVEYLVNRNTLDYAIRSYAVSIQAERLMKHEALTRIAA